MQPEEDEATAAGHMAEGWNSDRWRWQQAWTESMNKWSQKSPHHFYFSLPTQTVFAGSVWTPQGLEISRSGSFIQGRSALWIHSALLTQLKSCHEHLFLGNTSTPECLPHTLALVMSFTVLHTEGGTKNTAAVCSTQHSHELLWVVVTLPLKLNLNPDYGFLDLPLIPHRDQKGTLIHQRGNHHDLLILPHPRVLFLARNSTSKPAIR